LRNDVTDISYTDAAPQKRLARPPGADKGRVAHSASLHFQTVRPSTPAGTIFAESSPTSTPLRAVKFGEPPLY